jgi:hypothetical protein
MAAVSKVKDLSACNVCRYGWQKGPVKLQVTPDSSGVEGFRVLDYRLRNLVDPGKYRDWTNLIFSLKHFKSFIS